MRRSLTHLARCLLVAAAVAAASASLAAPAVAGEAPHIKHFFIIVLENENPKRSFSATPPAPYLGTTMREAGAFIPNYYGIGHASLDNYIAMISGQPPNPLTQADCPTFTELPMALTESGGVAVGQTCVYPGSVQTVANQLENSGHSWRGYMQDMASSTDGEPATCRHPAINGPDKTQTARPTDQYATRHDPFVYFHSIIDYATCQHNVVDLSRLNEDLANPRADAGILVHHARPLRRRPRRQLRRRARRADSPASTPSSRNGCRKSRAQPHTKTMARCWPPSTSPASGAQSCCSEPTGPNSPNNGGTQPGDGGGKVGAVMVSPCIKPGTVTQTSYNHYSMLRWVEDNFGLSHLADAAPAGPSAFGSDVFNNPSCEPPSSAPVPRSAGKLRLQARPRKVRAGHKTVFHFRVSGKPTQCAMGVTVKFAGHQLKVDRHGRARLKTSLHGRGRRLAVVNSPNCGKAKAWVRVMSTRTH